MKLILKGHDDLYAVEQLQMSLFPDKNLEGQAVSSLGRGKTWLTATTAITLGDRTTRSCLRLKAEKETVRSRRKLLQQCYYRAALPHLEKPRPGVRCPVCGLPNSQQSIFWRVESLFLPIR